MANEEQKPSVEGGGEAPKDALSGLIKKLEIPTSTEKEIQKLSQEEKEELEMLLLKILNEVESQKLGPTDKEQKIKDTLVRNYGIIVVEQAGKDKSFIASTITTNTERLTQETKEKSERLKMLGEKLDTVKNLDQTVVSEELANAKAKQPLLPQETKLAIAKATNTDPSQVDEAIKRADNPQIQNLVDTYYLTNPIVQSAIESRLPKEDKGKSYVAFQELRGSAREFGVLSPFTEKDLPSRLSDKSDKTQQEVVSTFNSINKGNPDTLITRTGDKLNWEGTDGKKYEIDMAVRPPKLSKSKNGLSLSYRQQPENPELQGVRAGVTAAREAFVQSTTDIHTTLRGAGANEIKIENYPPEMIRKLFSGEDFVQKLEEVSTTTTPERLLVDIREKRKVS